jgi:type I restriction enzyme, S subunit
MNAERLLAHYEQIADAPDAIARLRRFILNLAVRGKLVPQNANDEPALELLKRILQEKARRVKAGEIRTPKTSEPIRGDELPILLPQSWAWARLHDIGKLSGGMTPSMNRSDFWDGDIVWLSPKDIKSDEVTDSELRISAIGLAETGLELYRPRCLFMVARSGILKRTFPVSINRVPAAANQDMKVLAPFLDGQENYLQIMFRGLMDFLLRELVKTGTTVQSLKYAEFEQQPFPLPPLAEQHRIVAKVDELMALCDRLEAALGRRGTGWRRRVSLASTRPPPKLSKRTPDSHLTRCLT